MKKKEINILILSVGTRNKVVQYFKKALNGKGRVIATDISVLAPGLYEADDYYVVPRITNDNYMEIILTICKNEKISGVISLIDPELSLLAKHHNEFENIGCKLILSDYNIIEKSFNKFKFSQLVEENGFNSAKTYLSKDEFYTDLKNNRIHFPVIVKPNTGSASLNIHKVYLKSEVDLLFSKHEDLVIQEYIDGDEYGVDAYIDLYSNKLITYFVKKKIKMRAGETDKSVSVQDNQINEVVEKFIEKTSYSGIIDIDLFKQNGKVYISEVNPRFGGGAPHAFEAGVDFSELIINNLSNSTNEYIGPNYKQDIYMLKYNEISIFEDNN